MFNLFKDSFHTITMDKAKKELETNSSITLIDVRTKEEYEEGHIRNSINIPLDKLEIISNKVPNKDAKLYVYCLSGGRSHNACKILAKEGFSDVTNIGGIQSWDGPIVKD